MNFKERIAKELEGSKFHHSSKYHSPLFHSLLLQSPHMKKDAMDKAIGCVIPHDYPQLGLSLMSDYYNYTSPPPLAYGDPIPKTAESILRAMKFCGENGVHHVGINTKTIPIHYSTDTRIPITDEIGCQWEPSRAKEIFKAQISKNFNEFERAAKETIAWARSQESVILTKGRQTWCPITEASVTASQAYMNFIKLYKMNGIPMPSTLYDFMSNYFILLERNEVKYMTKEEKTIEKTVKTNGRMFQKTIKTYHDTVKTLTGDEVKETLYLWMTSFCSYLKSAERAHLHRRAIASPNMFYRCCLLISEHYHLTLSKHLPGTTIAIGGLEKMNKIINALCMPSQAGNTYSLQLTTDATKWNECLSPEMFALGDYVHLIETFPEDEEIQKFGKFLIMVNYILANKSMYVGGGPMAENDLFFNRLNWMDSEINLFNSETKKWLVQLRAYRIRGTNYVLASPGMLMGMKNGESTTKGNAAASALGSNVIEMRSSDDSASKYIGSNPTEPVNYLHEHLIALRILGINISKEKSFVATEQWLEYTSNYIDIDLKPIISIETTAMRPAGQTPYDDYNSIASNAAQALVQRKINHPAANALLKIGFSNVSRLWRIKQDILDHHPTNREVVFMADGGDPWCNCTSSQIPEAGYRLYKAKLIGDDALRYVETVLHPDNPFIKEEKDITSYDKDVGTMVDIFSGTPRNVFTLTLRGNRTEKNTKRGAFYRRLKDCAHASRVIQTLYPYVTIAKPISNRTILSAYKEELIKDFKSLPLESQTAELKHRLSVVINKLNV